MTAYEFRNEVVGKMSFRIGELKAKREHALSLKIQDEAALRRLEGNIGALEWAIREVAIMDVGYVPPSRERRAAINAAIDRQFPRPDITPGKR